MIFRVLYFSINFSFLIGLKFSSGLLYTTSIGLLLMFHFLVSLFLNELLTTTIPSENKTESFLKKVKIYRKIYS